MEITKAKYSGDLPSDRANSTATSWFHDIKEVPYQFALNQTATGMDPSFGGGSEQKIIIGAGDTAFNVDLGGMWMGHRRYAEAPFRVNMRGEGVGRFYTTDGGVIFDENGIGSIANFDQDTKTISVDQTITGTSWQDITGLTHSINGITRSRIALFFANISGYHDDTSGRLEFRFTLNTMSVGGVFCLNRVAAAGAIQTATNMLPIELGEGDNDVIIQARSSNANSGYIKGATIESTFSYILLGR